ncbi:MAG TPA: hypothetical protein VGM69_23225, partial [Chloroflexota bacterium]
MRLTLCARVLFLPLMVLSLGFAVASGAAGQEAPTPTPSPPPGGFGCPCSIWDDAVVPAVPAEPDIAPVEVGVKFRADADGQVS